MTSSNKKYFFDSDIVYELELSDIRFLSGIFNFLIVARPNYIKRDNTRLTYEYWAGYFSALSDNIEPKSDKKFVVKLFIDDYLFLRSVVYDSFINNWISGEEEKIDKIFENLEKIYNTL